MPKRKRFLGTSEFTHVDDATAPIHTTHHLHQDALIYGGEVPPKHQLEEVILGPPAYGSPDPRSLGHIMMPLKDGPSSALPLDSDFEELRGTASGSELYTEEELNQMNKSEVLKYAKSVGIEATASTKKDELIKTIGDEYGFAEDTEAEELGGETDEDEQ